MWIFLILLYGIFKGFREALKKKAMETRSVLEVLFFYTLFAFILVIPFSKGIFDISWRAHVVIFLKSFAIFIAWICALNSIKKLPLSVYCIADMGRMVFSIIFGIVILNETLFWTDAVGVALVLLGITLVNFHSKKNTLNEQSLNGKILILCLGIIAYSLFHKYALLFKIFVYADGCIIACKCRKIGKKLGKISGVVPEYYGMIKLVISFNVANRAVYPIERSIISFRGE